jgi:chromosome partitioning protein
MARIIAVSNQKGGVGKTTTAVNLAAALARAGHPTLLLDLDPQGNASSALGHRKEDVQEGIAEVILGLGTLAQATLPTQTKGLTLCPATAALVGAEVELVALPNRDRRLAFALAELPPELDFVIIDCPPSLGMLTLNALVAADSVLIPLQAEYFAMEGLGDLVRTVAAVRRGPNPNLVREGIVITMWDARANLCREVEAEARRTFGREVFDTVIPRAIRLAEAPSFGKTIFQHDGASRAAKAYAALAHEVVRRAIAAAKGQTAAEASA